MFKKIKGLLKSERKRSFRRAPGDFRLCVNVFNKKSNSTKCFLARVSDYSAGGLCLYHGNKLAVGDQVEIGNKHTLKKLECLTCVNLPLTSDKFGNSLLRGTVVWRTEKLCGVQFSGMKNMDEREINKMAIDKISGG